MSVFLKNMMIVRLLSRRSTGQGFHQVNHGFLCQSHTYTSQSNHLCQKNSLLKVQHYHYSQTFRSSSCYLQNASVLQRHYLGQKFTWKRRQWYKPYNHFCRPQSAVCACLPRLTCKSSYISSPSTQYFQTKCPCLTLQTSSFSTSVRCVRTCPPWRVLFFGSDRFSVTALKALNENMMKTEPKFKVVDSLEVVCPVAVTPVKKYCKEVGLNIHEWPVKVDKGKFDVGVLSSFGKMIPAQIINTFPYGIINIHPSLLPRWRGAAPIPHTILNGDTHAGVTIMELRAKHFDTGPILLQKSIPVPEGSTSFQLYDLLAIQGVKLMLAALCDLPTLERLEMEQPSSGITYAPKITHGMEFLDWENSTVCDIDRQYRAIHEIMPLRSKYRDQNVKLYDMSPINAIPDEVIEPLVQRLYNVSSSSMISPGRTYFLKNQNCLLIKCKDGWVGFHSIGMRKVLTAQSFYSGFLSQPGSVHNYFESQPNTLKTYSTPDIKNAVHVQQ